MRISIAILAMGGEGGGVLSDWLVDLAEHNGYLAQATSVPGVAQRTGSTIYYVEMFPAAMADGREPVFALMPAPGEVDIVVASELMEAGRAIQRGLVTKDRTTLIASTHRIYSMTERTASGDGRVDSDVILEACETAARRLVIADYDAVAGSSRSVISAALFGALAGSGALPFGVALFEETIRRGGVGVESSIAAFRVAQSARRSVEADVDVDVMALARERLIDYQDARYADLFLELIAPLQGAVRLEAARQLALWMSYEDAIRVADLKTRRARFEHVRREARAGCDEVLKIHDFVFPRVGEIADIMPASMGRWMLASAVARTVVGWFTHHGRVIETTSVSGFLRLWFIGKLRGWRRSSLRYQREHRKIREWIALVAALQVENEALALEVASWPSVLKGYGDTHACGERIFDELMAALRDVRSRPDAVDVLKQMRLRASEAS